MQWDVLEKNMKFSLSDLQSENHPQNCLNQYFSKLNKCQLRFQKNGRKWKKNRSELLYFRNRVEMATTAEKASRRPLITDSVVRGWKVASIAQTTGKNMKIVINYFIIRKAEKVQRTAVITEQFCPPYKNLDILLTCGLFRAFNENQSKTICGGKNRFLRFFKCTSMSEDGIFHDIFRSTAYSVLF